jgi:hypothetical protein
MTTSEIAKPRCWKTAGVTLIVARTSKEESSLQA